MGPGLKRSTAWVISGVLAVATAVLVFVFVLKLASSPEARNNLGDQVFSAGHAATLAPEVDQHGPLLFRDAIGRNRDIVLDHVSGRRWVAFEARLPDGCRIELDRRTGRLRDCHGRAVASDPPPSTSYPVRIDKHGDLIVDLRRPSRLPSS